MHPRDTHSGAGAAAPDRAAPPRDPPLAEPQRPQDGELQFSTSRPLTLGVELELMLIDRDSGELVSASQVFLGQLAVSDLVRHVKAEITQSMVELNSSIHENVAELATELRSLCKHAVAVAESLHISVSGGGAHPFRTWEQRQIYPAERFEKLHEAFGYLAKQFTVFGQHVHVGVPSADDAIYLTHAINRYVPHLIALSAGSPFQRGVDTAFQSSRANVVSVFPLSGHLPPVGTWAEFKAHFGRLQATGVVESMKDFYWDVRPKPEFGTVEVRVLDTPVSLEQAVNLAACVQALAGYCLSVRQPVDLARLYEGYAINRFAAARFGLEATLVNLESVGRVALADELLALLEAIEPFAVGAAAVRRLRKLRKQVELRETDAGWMRARQRALGDFKQLMREQAARLLEPARGD